MSKLFSIDDLLDRAGTDDKFELTRLAIQRVRRLVKEKDKRALDNSQEKFPTLVLQEMLEGKIKPFHVPEKE